MIVRLVMLWFLLAGSIFAQEQPDSFDSNVLRIGVRGSASPFSYKVPTSNSLTAKSGPIRAKGYDGYMVHVCDEVLKQMLIAEPPLVRPDQIIPIDLDDKDVKGEVADRFDLLGKTVDILCDPATISRDRVRRFAVSVPLFMTGIGYLTLRDGKLPKDVCVQDSNSLIGVVGGTNAAVYGIREILKAGEWQQYKENILYAVRNIEDKQSGDCPSLNDRAAIKHIIEQGSDHADLAKRFCDGKITYYVGDLEIISAHAAKIAGCEVSPSAQTFTDDRYAIYAAINYGNEDRWKALVIGRFFDILSREIVASDSLLDRAYVSAFGDAPRSRKLEWFFWSMRGPL